MALMIELWLSLWSEELLEPGLMVGSTVVCSSLNLEEEIIGVYCCMLKGIFF